MRSKKNDWERPCSSAFAKKSRRRRHAFTLLEMMFVFILIGLLAGLVTVSARHYLVKGKQNAARAEISNLAAAVETFYATAGRYPTSEEGIAILTKKSEKFPESLLSQVPLDPWGRAYQYNNPGRAAPFEIATLGADGREGGQGADVDIGSWNLKENAKDASYAASK